MTTAEQLPAGRETPERAVRGVGYPVRQVDMVSLKALAHPLRIQILEMLARHGPQTACSLGEMLGESSGSTSYHLRQLAKHDFVHEVQGKGTARERWWERPKGSIEIGSRDLSENPATGEATRLVSREFEHIRAAALADFMEHGCDLLPPEWEEAASIGSTNVRLSAAQLHRYTQEVEAFARRLLEEIRSEGEPEGARPVQIHFNAFPLSDGHTGPAGTGARKPVARVSKPRTQSQHIVKEEP